MSRSSAAALASLTSLLPPGWVWPRGDDSVLSAVLAPIAGGIADVEALAEQMMDEVDPRTASLCLADFERVLGPDPCGRDTALMPLADRQRLTHQRWTGRGGQSIAYFVALAAARGVEITIEEAWPTEAGPFQAGDELVETPEQFVWVVRMALTDLIEFEAGQSTAGDPLYQIVFTDIECDIRRAKPAHTEVAFHYFEEA